MDKRNTIQKSIVLDAVRTLATHSTADDIYEYIHKVYPSVGKGTVYRNLNILAQEGKIRRVEVSDGPDRFDFTVREHYHVECIKCGCIEDVDMDVIPDMLNRIKSNNGFYFFSYNILFKGICPSCGSIK